MNPTPQASDRQIRVFISSTFRDMMRERDLLVKEVFPELRRKCACRLVTFTEVDLRWGITEQQANEGQVLPLCLAEIERSRPYFIGLLGQRYGWIPDTIRPELIEQEPWLREHITGRTSVTELEILHGVLNNPTMEHRAFFYFRDPAYTADPTLTLEERRDLVERDIRADVERYGAAEAALRTQERQAKLAAIKERIEKSGLPVVKDYANPRALADLVRRQFDELIDRLFPEQEVPDPLVQERIAHEAHARNKLFACIDRPGHLAALNAFASSGEQSGQGLVVTGESGGGKTVLLAAWARDWVQNHPLDFLFQHYFGATPDSASPEGFLRRLLGELNGRFGFTDDIPAYPEKLREALPFWLARTTGKCRVVLVLDGLNQVQGSEPDRRLLFLPRHFPPHVVVLASALFGPALEALRERGWAEHELPLASEAEVEAMVDAYLKIHARALEPALQRQLVSAPGARNPLFLRTVLEELRQFGSFERLPQRVGYYLEADNPQDLFRRVLARWQGDFDSKDEVQEPLKRDLVRRALTHLWAARQGLSEPEWLDLLGVRGEPLPRALWTPLLLAVEPHLSQRGGLLAFGHVFLRQAVEELFVLSGDLRQAAHLTLADYFERHARQQDMTPRKAAEWPYQLHAAEVWDRLEGCLTDISLFLALYNGRTKWELTGYWHPLRGRGRDMGDCYSRAYASWVAVPVNTGDHYVSAQIGQFLIDNGLYTAAEPLLKQAFTAREHVLGPEHPDTLSSVNDLANLLESKGDYAAAEPLYRRALSVRECVLGPEHPDTLFSVNNLAVLLYRKGDYTAAESLYRRALSAQERVLGLEHPHTLTSVHNLAGLLQSKGDFAAAEPLCWWVLSIYERMLGPEHPDTLSIVNSLAFLLESKGDHTAAESLYRRVLSASERVLGPEHPDTLRGLNNLAFLLKNKGDYAAAEPLYRRVLSALEHVVGPEHPDTLISLDNLADLLESKGDHAAAEPLYRRALSTFERVLGPEHSHTLNSVSCLAGLLYRKGDYAAAESLYRRAFSANEHVLGPEHPETLRSVNNLAVLLKNKGDYEAAEPLYRRVLEASERVLGPEHPHTLFCVNNLAGLLENKGDLLAAETLYRRALSAFERVLGPEHPQTLTIQNNLAALLDRKGNSVAAESLYRQALSTRERVLGPEHPDTLTSLNNLAVLLESKGDIAAAEPLYRRALSASERLVGPEHPYTLRTMHNLAFLLENKGDSAAAEPLYRQVLQSLLKISVSMQRAHPNLQICIENYEHCLEQLGRRPEEIRRVLETMMHPLGMALGRGSGRPGA